MFTAHEHAPTAVDALLAVTHPWRHAIAQVLQ